MKDAKTNSIFWLIPCENTAFDQYAERLRQCGFLVNLFNYRNTLSSLGIHGLHKNIIETVERLDDKKDLLVLTVFDGSVEISPEFLRSIPSNVRKIIWNFDDEMYGTHSTLYRIQSVDGFITTDEATSYLANQLGVPAVTFLSGAFDYSKEYDQINCINENLRDIDVCFIGDVKKNNRYDYLSYLKFNGINVEIFGEGSLGGTVTSLDMYKIYKRAKICLNFSSSDISYAVYKEEPWRENIRQIKGRPFEICSSGAFCLTEYAYGLEKYFIPGEDLDCFHDKDSLLNQVKKYLENNAQRVKISSSGQKKAIYWQSKEYMFNAVDSLVKKINETPPARVNIYKSKQYKLKELYYSLIFSIRFILLRKYKYAIDVLFYFKAYRIFNPIYLLNICELLFKHYVYIK